MRILSKLFILLFISLLLGINSSAQVILPLGSNWNYFKGTSQPPTNWKEIAFDDNLWLNGNAPFHYGDGTGGTTFSDMQNQYTTVYFRKKITLTYEDSLIDKVNFIYNYDDGFRLWINGSIVLERNAPLSERYDTLATANHESGIPDTLILSNAITGLKKGDNIIDVEGFNVNKTSSDFYFDLQIAITQKLPLLPKAPDPVFSKNGGYYTDTFTLVITSQTFGDTIKYTLDCTEPDTSATAFTGKSPLKIKIDPSSLIGRPNTPAVVVSALVQKQGYSNRHPETRTYIFTKAINTQKYPGGTWPSRNISSQIIDYNIDSRVVNDSKYSSIFSSTFSSIPTVSVVTDNKNLFDSLTGIYVNAMEHGAEWERQASLELINTDNSEAFSVGAGLRIRGGWSRHDNNPKHAFRIFFSSQYGKKSLKYPIFGADAAQEFDKFDLRCTENYSWAFYNDPLMTYAQDEFCRDMQGHMEHPYTRTQYCHLFLNGMYWGLYEFQERPEANFAASYFGGNKDEYDVIKVATDLGNIIEATDGTILKWQQLYNISEQGFADNAKYNKVQGINSYNVIDTTLENYVDIDNLIDYMLDIFYSGNFDAPLSAFGGNNMPNNFYGIRNFKHKRSGFMFFVHDAEHTMNYVPGSGNGTDRGVNEDRVNIINDPVSPMHDPGSVNYFTPQWLHYKFMANSEYRQKFADKAYKYLYNNGLLTPTVAEKVFRNRANQISTAIISESARWGDTNNGTLRTKDNAWIPAINNTVSQFIKLRTPIVIQQLKSAGLIASLDAPLFTSGSNTLDVQEYPLTDAMDIALNNPNTTGDLYYTLNGTDPRNYRGGLNASATKITDGSTVNISFPLWLKARVYDGNKWSALHELLFTNTENRRNLRITEIQYHPEDYGSEGSKDLEFLEIKNIGDKGIDIGGCRLDSGIKFTFPHGTIVNPKGFAVVASNQLGFEFRYKMKPTGQYVGNLSNDGERVVLVDESNNLIFDATYNVGFPWPNANGSGYSLVSATSNPNSDPNNNVYWKTSALKWGSPFSDDSTYVPENSKTNSFITEIDVYPNPTSDKLFIVSNSANIETIQISDVSGRLVYSFITTSKNLRETEILLNQMNLNKGIYLLKVKTNVGVKSEKIFYLNK